MHKAFISYHHLNDQIYKEKLLTINSTHHIFIDGSVDTNDVDDNLSDESIREIIRDDYLKDTSVTILLVGLETKNRKHIDWELYSSMYDGKVNKKSGMLVINLPATQCLSCTATHDGEKERVHPDVSDWISIDIRSEYESKYPVMPPRIIDNLLDKNVKISVVSWDKIEEDPSKLSFLIDSTYEDRNKCDYDLSRSMMRADL